MKEEMVSPKKEKEEVVQIFLCLWCLKIFPFLSLRGGRRGGGKGNRGGGGGGSGGGDGGSRGGGGGGGATGGVGEGEGGRKWKRGGMGDYENCVIKYFN